jgi:hypothetical protein
MMKESEILRKLGAAAAREEVPRTNVRPHFVEVPPAVEEDFSRPLFWIAGLSAATALPAIILALYALDTWTDPLITLFEDLTGMMS